MQHQQITAKIADLATRYDIADLYVFGSRSKEIAAWVRGSSEISSNVPSDIDIGVYPEEIEPWSAEKRVQLIMELEDLFQVSRVDLVLLPEADPFLALDIVRGEMLFTSDPDRQARNELFLLRRAADLIPFQKERIRMILEEGAR